MVQISYLILGAIAVAGAFIWGALVFFAQRKIRQANQLLSQTRDKLKNVQRDVENERREASLKVKDELYKKRIDFEQEMKRGRADLNRLQQKVHEKVEGLEKREAAIDELRSELQQKERKLSRTEDVLRADEAKIKGMYNELVTKLERISSMSKDEARQMLLESLESEVRLANQKWVQKIEEEAKQEAKDRAVNHLICAMQRYAADQVAPHASSVVTLPNDEMKGRIIGKEGRNIKALEMATGMEFIIGETPELITISGFNPVRREVARRSLEKLIADGRINPTRIEEVVAQCEKELDEVVMDYGRKVILETNLQGVNEEIIGLLGKLYFRTSFSQNVLEHSREVGMFARLIAEELGLDGTIALRAGVMHDIGKAISAEVEGPHAIIGSEVAKRCGESPVIVNAIAAHHEEVGFTSPYAPIIVIADTLSASRPGARRETLSAYLKRLERLEEIANSFEGVKKAYALQAGREIRIIVEEDRLDDEKALNLARDIARKVESELTFPGQIKVNVIREKRAIEYAR